MGKSFVRDARWKLANDGGFFDLKNAPFEEIPVTKDTTDADAQSALKRLQRVLDDHQAAPWNDDSKQGKKNGTRPAAKKKAGS